MLTPASGIGKFALRSCKVIRFVRQGCTNRPFYHIVIQEVDIHLITEVYSYLL